MRVKWEEKTPHSEVLEREKCCSIESILKKGSFSGLVTL
jgi:hypothetical protein